MTIIVRRMAKVLVVVAIICSLTLVMKDTGVTLPWGISQTTISAASLMLVGGALLIAQTLIHPQKMELMRNILLSAAFILWGFVQLLPSTTSSKKLGDIVVALYVIDVAWTILAIVKHRTLPQR